MRTTEGAQTIRGKPHRPAALAYLVKRVNSTRRFRLTNLSQKNAKVRW